MASIIHRYHPDPKMGDPEDAVLWDNCSACEQNAMKPAVLLDVETKRVLREAFNGFESDNPNMSYKDCFKTDMEARAACLLFIREMIASLTPH